MKNWIFIPFAILHLYVEAQTKKWSNSSGNSLWNNALNWIPVGIPLSSDDVIFDNAYFYGSYVVDLPPGTTATIIHTLTLSPNANNSIRLRLPITNTSQPGFVLSGTTGDVMQINKGGIFENSSGAPSSPSITISGSVRINNGGRYFHNTISTASSIVNHLSLVSGTESGVIEYGQVSSNSLLSSGVTYNSIELSTTSNKVFSFSGNSPTAIRGYFMIDSGVTFSSLKVGDLYIAGDLMIHGSFDLTPPTFGNAERSLIFNGSLNQNISGSGVFSQGINFRNLIVGRGAMVTLLRSLSVNNAADSIIIDTFSTIRMGTYIISGLSKFIGSPLATLSIGSSNGINAIGNNSGNIQTLGSRYFDTSGIYEYYSTGNQITGTGLPVVVKKLIINKADFSSVSLTNPVIITDTVSLQKGYISTTRTALLKLRDSTKIISPPSIFNSLLSLTNIGYEKSFINGPMMISVSSQSGKWFPVGKVVGIDTLFAPVKLNKFNNIPTIDTVEYNFGAHFDAANIASPPLDHISKIEYWDIHCNSDNTDCADTITLSWSNQSKVGNGNPSYSATALNDLTIAHYFDDDGPGPNPKRWNIDGGSAYFFTAGNVVNGMIRTLIPVSTSAAFTLGTKSPYNILPVHLIDFDGANRSTNNYIYWITDQDLTIQKYDIEKSNNGIDFYNIGSTNSRFSSTLTKYEYFDHSLIGSCSYYRLKIIDTHHHYYYSKTIILRNETRWRMEIYPNPVNQVLYVYLRVPSSTSSIEIVNMLGKVIRRQHVTQVVEKINIENLSTGMYSLRLTIQDQTFSQNFIKR